MTLTHNPKVSGATISLKLIFYHGFDIYSTAYLKHKKNSSITITIVFSK